MPTKKHGIIIETPGEARQAEPGPSVLALLTISTALSALILGGLWYVPRSSRRGRFLSRRYRQENSLSEIGSSPENLQPRKAVAPAGFNLKYGVWSGP